MCNSYNNGHCNYYGVEVMDLNYKCERGECMGKGFTIKCNECGLQVIYNQHGNLLAKDNDDITMHSLGYTHETRAGIYCECGNKIGYIEEDEAEGYIHPYAAKSNAERGR